MRSVKLAPATRCRGDEINVSRRGAGRLPAPIVVNEVTLVGSRCGPFARAIELLAAGAVRVQPLVTRVTSLDDYESAFADARRGLKVIIS